ncbi:MAG: hypothetical protein JRN45_00360 [Nitrososphaerota archaeon]|nr:hypothetical protein [Nitrososphaerota archaeon]
MIRRNGISNIIAMILLIALAVVGSGVYFIAVTSYLRPQAGLSPQVTISVGASGFTVVNAQAVNTGGIPFTSLSVSITGGGSQLQIAYSALLSAGGGRATITVSGVSGGTFTAVSPSTTVSGSLTAEVGSAYAVVIEGTLTNGGTFSQALSVEAAP